MSGAHHGDQCTQVAAGRLAAPGGGLLSTAACAGDRAGGPGSTMAPEARTCLLSALDTMERHAPVRDEVDWPKLGRDTLGRAGGASGPADTHEAIEQALGDLCDGHSTFLTPEEAARAEDGTPDDQVLPPRAAGSPRASATSR
ncbi:hypothetical protein [Streptomyces sp. OUCMDZ-3434]|uniref:hypothetical protein n=1 Tax=Streptomyces sp. OUCMDZ-3434 TaxID=1535304 RepID=UPI001E61ECF8|nr:hypothetical protein [Streptomyces sp. OUCMDZ-3434]